MKRKHIRTIIICALVLLAAVTVIFNIDIEPKEQPSQSVAVSSPATETKKPQAEPSENETEETDEKETESEKNSVTENEVSEKALTEKHDSENEKNSAPEQKPEKEEITAKTPTNKNVIPQESKTSDKKYATAITSNEKTPSLKPERHFCTIEIRCDTVVDTSKLDNPAVAPYIPKNGVILKAAEIEFAPGESVFDILYRATKERNIQMEFRDDSLYSGKYIEGINYLYEMDGGPLSGWMYKVNGKFPNYGCAAYKVSDKDAIVFVYTCDLGVDVGDNSTW